MRHLIPALLIVASPVLADDLSLTGTYSGVVACERTENGLPGIFRLDLDIRVRQSGDRLDVATWTAEDEALQRRTASLYSGKAVAANGQVSGYLTACRPDFEYVETIRILPTVKTQADFGFAADTIFVTESLPGREGHLIVESCRWIMTRNSTDVPEMQTCSGN
ncbi:MAG: hypothetical protein AAGB04_29815 [Pseudomonadota bacterium]